MKKNEEKKIAVFGVFDGLHPGHLDFFKQAKNHGKKLVAIVAKDAAVKRLKNKTPAANEEKRVAEVASLKEVDEAVLGDDTEGEYEVLKIIAPDAICLGYDQNWLARDLAKKIESGFLSEIELIRLKPYHPEKFKSSLLNGKNK